MNTRVKKGQKCIAFALMLCVLFLEFILTDFHFNANFQVNFNIHKQIKSYIFFSLFIRREHENARRKKLNEIQNGK